MERLADADAGGWVGGLAVDAAGEATICGGAASNGESVVHLVDADCGRWAVGRLPADAVGWAIV